MNEPSSLDPYAPPQAPIAPGGSAPEEAEQIRREFLKRETSVRGIGTLALCFGGLFGLTTLGLLVATLGFAVQGGSSTAGSMLAVGIVYGTFTAIFLYIGRGLRRLDRGSVLATTLICLVGLLAYPFGTALSLFFLYLLYSAKGRRVLTPEYQLIVARTPHIQQRMPIWLIVLAFLFIAGIAAFLYGVMQGLSS